MSKVLSLKDRFRLFKRLLKMIFDKDLGYVNLLWIDKKGNHLTHTFYADGITPREPFLTYMATVAASGENLEDVNACAEYYLSKTIVAYTKLNDLNLDDYGYVVKPIRLQEKQNYEH